MTNRKLIKYAVASSRNDEVALNEGWGAGSSLVHRMEVSEGMGEDAIRRSGLKNIGLGGLVVGCLYALAGAGVGAIAGVIFLGNGDDTGLALKVLYKIGGLVGGFVGGGTLAGLIPYYRLSVNERIVSNLIKERERRKEEWKRGREERGLSISISEGQRRSARGSLITQQIRYLESIVGKGRGPSKRTEEQMVRDVVKIEGELRQRQQMLSQNWKEQ